MKEKLDIRHIKMINGDEILALINQNNETNMLIERPVRVDSNMIGGYSLTPWFPFTKASLFKIHKNRIVASVKIDETVQKNYINFVLARQDKIAKVQSNTEILSAYADMLMKEHAEDEEYLLDNEELDEISTKEKTIH